MSEAYKNFAAVLDILHEYNAPVTTVEHEHNYTDGDLVEFELKIAVDGYGSDEWRDFNE